MLNWVNITKERLKQHRFDQQAISNITAQIAHLREAMTRLRGASADGTPVKGGGSGREDMLIDCIVQCGELEVSLFCAKGRVKQIDRAMGQLRPDDQLVLTRLYIDNERGSVDRLREELGLQDNRSVYKRANAALARLSMLMYGDT